MITTNSGKIDLVIIMGQLTRSKIELVIIMGQLTRK
jgi:hypothetical protein